MDVDVSNFAFSSANLPLGFLPKAPTLSTDAGQIVDPKALRLMQLKAKDRAKIQQASNSFESSIKKQLWRLTRPEQLSVSDRAINSHYFSELAKPLSAIPQNLRVNFLCELFQNLLDEQRQVTRHFVESELYKVLRYTDKTDRLAVTRFILDQSTGHRAIDLVQYIFKESREPHELRSMLNQLSEYNLENKKTRKLRELLAAADLQPVLMSRLRKRLPKAVANNASRIVIKNRLPLVSEWLDKQIRLCEESRFKQSEVARDYRSTFKHAKAIVNKIARTKDIATMREHFNTLIKKLKLECELGICLRSAKAKNGSWELVWTVDTVKDVGTVYRQLPAILLLTTPGFHAVEFTMNCIDADDCNTLGYVSDEGDTFLGKIGIDGEPGWSHELRLKSALQGIIAHELGHSLQIQRTGNSPRFNKWGEIVGCNGPRYDFKRFLNLCGITIMREGFKVDSLDQVVTIDEASYILGKIYRFNGQIGIFTYDKEENLLYFVETVNCDTPVGTYWQKSPWEAWAEVFGQYLRVSRFRSLQKIQNLAVPTELLRYFEDLFGLNDKNPAFLKYISRSAPHMDARAEELQKATGLFSRAGVLGQAFLVADLIRKVFKHSKNSDRTELTSMVIEQLSESERVQCFFMLLRENPKLLTPKLIDLLEKSVMQQPSGTYEAAAYSDFAEQCFIYQI